MKKSFGKLAFYSMMVFVVVSCVTINIYFPAAAVEKAAEEIVEEVWGEFVPGAGEAPVDSTEEGSLPEGSSIKVLRHLASFISFGPGEAYAAGPTDINVTTPAIRALKGAIQRRAASLKPFLNRGNVGITKDGLLSIRSDAGLNLKEKAQLKKLVNAENRDRESLYREIAKANDIGADKVPEIKKLFARSWIKNAHSGWWMQGSNGKWSKK